MKRRNFFRGLLGLIGVGASGFLVANSAPKNEYMKRPKHWMSDTLKVKYPKIEWPRKDLFPHWIDVTGFNMKGVSGIVTLKDGSFRRFGIMGDLWVSADEYIEYKYKSYRVWELIKSGDKAYLHYKGFVAKPKAYFEN